jgi:hypothetical protein
MAFAKALWLNFGNGLKCSQTFVDLPFSLFSHENVPLVSLWLFFHKGDKQNTVHFMTYCNGCMEHHSRELLSELRNDIEMDDASQLERQGYLMKTCN